MTDTIGIQFYFDGKQYAYRSWPRVPRRGDEVVLHYEGELSVFIVVSVQWGEETDTGRQIAAIEVTRPNNPTRGDGDG